MLEELLKETDRLIEERPRANEVLTAFRELTGIMAEEVPHVEQASPDERLLDIKREEGFPFFSREELPIDFDSGTRLLTTFLQTLQKGERPDRESLRMARIKCQQEETWAGNLFNALLRNDEKDLSKIAGDVGLEPEALKFLAQMALTPSIHLLRDQFTDGIDTETWDHGYCPFCGSQPSISFFEKTGKRYMHCGFCGLEWRFPRLKCPFCDNHDQKTLGYFNVEKEDGFRVDFCRQCKRYIKVVDKRVLEKAGPMELENLASLHLDILAAKEGFR
jgi:FdhE protein